MQTERSKSRKRWTNARESPGRRAVRSVPSAKGVTQAAIGVGTIGAGAAIITAGIRPDLAAKVIQRAKNRLPALKLVR